MTLPFAVLGALIAAILETSVVPELNVAGARADLVLALAVVATMIMGVEDGLAWAFVGGLLLDMLTPARPLGATTLALLLVVGVAALAARVLGPSRLRAGLAAFVLTWPFHFVLIGALILTAGVAIGPFDPWIVFFAALMNGLVAIVAAIAFGAIDRRFGPAERADW